MYHFESYLLRLSQSSKGSLGIGELWKPEDIQVNFVFSFQPWDPDGNHHLKSRSTGGVIHVHQILTLIYNMEPE